MNVGTRTYEDTVSDCRKNAKIIVEVMELIMKGIKWKRAKAKIDFN